MAAAAATVVVLVVLVVLVVVVVLLLLVLAVVVLLLLVAAMIEEVARGGRGEGAAVAAAVRGIVAAAAAATAEEVVLVVELEEHAQAVLILITGIIWLVLVCSDSQSRTQKQAFITDAKQREPKPNQAAASAQHDKQFSSEDGATFLTKLRLGAWAPRGIAKRHRKS
jgi:hypothetical protein